MSATRTKTTGRTSGPRFLVGIDPGKTGAACLLDGRRLLLVLSWRPSTRERRRGYLVETRAIGRRSEAWRATIGAVGRDLLGEVLRLAGASPSLALTVEDVYVGRGVRSAMVLARTSGALAGPIEALVGREARLVMAVEWRASVIGLALASTGREDAKRAAVERIPPLVEGWTLLVDTTTEHIADAVGIALYGGLATNGEDDGTAGAE
jgi:Holliday junction resolvasome RuvABC endonuclease subunit